MGEDSVATAMERPATTRILQHSGSSAVTAEQALLLFEARRARAFAAGLTVLCIAGFVLVLAVGGDPFAQKVHAGGIAVTGIVAAAYALHARDVDHYRPWKVALLVFTAIATNATGFYYWGVFSGYFGVVTMSAYAFSSTSAKRTAIWGLSLSIATHAALGLAQIAGHLDDRGIVQVGNVATQWQLLLLGVFQLILVGAVLAGTHAYRTLHQVLDAHDAALRDLAVREAQLAEAHEAVREQRGPGEGKYTGMRLGRFELANVIGRGAMGEVYAAVDDQDMRCAVKVLASHLHGNADALARFYREARAIAQLSAPNIVRMLDVSPPGAAVPFLAMELLEGRDLRVLMKEQPLHTPADVLLIVRQAAAGLDAAHAAGVVHRDLKPSNLFAATTTDGTVWKVLDFGVSKATDDATLTGAAIVGTPGYMAPEQARGETVDRRADVYALGVVIYRLLTGRPAIVPGDLPAMIHEVVYKMPPRPSELAPVSADVEAVLAVALAKNRDDRFATAGELAAALAEATANMLPNVTHERATAILARTPWGGWVRARTRAPTTRLR